MTKLDKEEEEILKSYESDEWQSVPDSEKNKQRYAEYARNTFQKNKRINIRISESDLTRLKAKSIEEGVPYQTLVSSLIHKFVTGKIIV
jgi:predicted DNA binding CopG/RHH family protein